MSVYHRSHCFIHRSQRYDDDVPTNIQMMSEKVAIQMRIRRSMEKNPSQSLTS